MRSDEKDDPYLLERFVQAQEGTYEKALAEIRAGDKRSHWMWFIFPQLAGLGRSPTSRKYAIKNVAEAKAYLRHPVLGMRLQTCVRALLALHGRSAAEIFGNVDESKLQSCATLFATVSPDASIFHQLLDRYFSGKGDQATISLLK
jgi:uncharacterized protein (DUF1810 family)